MELKPCPHMNFEADIKVIRLEDTGKFYAEIKINCSDCKMPMKFIGMEMGLSPFEPMMSPDELIATLPIRPSLEQENP